MGIDRSPEMLAHARDRAGQGSELIRATLPDETLARRLRADAAVCCFDSVNYFAGDGELSRLLGFAARCVRPGGIFVFDVNTKRKLAEIFGNSHYGDDHGDFAYVWRNRYDEERHRTEFLITLFTRNGAHFERHEEHHVQRWFSTHEITDAAKDSGFELLSIHDDYSAKLADPASLRETWVLRRIA
jgi:SAM-dependent methyltransferase